MQPIALAESGGTYNFSGSGTSINIYAEDLNWASVDFTNPWGFGAIVRYVDVDDGEIYLRVNKDFNYDPMYYYDWTSKSFIGNGIWKLPIDDNGGRYVNVTNSPNVTGFIEYPEKKEKAVFLWDTVHHETDLTVIVHNGELLENATVSLINGDPTIVLTDEIGEAKFTLGTGTYHLIVEHKNFSSMLIDDLYLEADKSYHIRVNMTNCLSNDELCNLDADDLIIYYKDKEPAMGSISPQGFVDHFADRLRMCEGIKDNCADGTLERMATQWGIYPKNLNVLLYSHNFTKLEYVDGHQIWEVTYTIKNYQEYKCTYTINLIANDSIIELNSGELPPTWSIRAKTTNTNKFTISDCYVDKPIYLSVESERSNT